MATGKIMTGLVGCFALHTTIELLERHGQSVAHFNNG